ncbi:MAG: hypothetical protein WD708_11415, partial [Kiritimatiellia bacterium]
SFGGRRRKPKAAAWFIRGSIPQLNIASHIPKNPERWPLQEFLEVHREKCRVMNTRIHTNESLKFGEAHVYEFHGHHGVFCELTHVGAGAQGFRMKPAKKKPWPLSAASNEGRVSGAHSMYIPRFERFCT